MKTFEEQLAFANSIVGKRVKSKNSYGSAIVSKVRILTEIGHASSSVDVHIEKHGWCVVVSYGIYSQSVMDIDVVDEFKVKLNETYTAIVSLNGVEVGCQTFPIEKIKDILKAHQQLIS